ncbi:MAG: L-fucose:H+ symporter permease [Terrimicrobiaceae bacterium]|nr:L-fucose:H+ symporter permease [Terrimicrobiaceae bacterium]
MNPPRSTAALLPAGMILPFALVTSLFALWGFANDITNPMVAAFRNILLISHFESSLVQFAFYGGYCVMAIPAALFIKRFSYKAGILAGLALYAAGCFLFVPAGHLVAFWAFLLAYFIMTCGLSFLETSANPYILAMGDEKTATRRLNFAQAFNPMGSLTGMFVAKDFILARLDPADEARRQALQSADPAAFDVMRQSDLSVIIGPYVILGLFVAAVLVLFAVVKLPGVSNDADRSLHAGPTFRRLMANRRYVEGVIAQAFYVGAQIMCWTFIIQYGVNEVGITKAEAQGYNIVAMVLFVASRFVCTFILRYLRPRRLLAALALGGMLLTLGTIFLPGHAGLYCLVGISGCMSLMFPTIYGIALDGLGDDAKLGSAGLILAIGGGCFMPPIQGAILDLPPVLGLSSTRLSFVLPLVCFVVIAIFGYRTFRIFHARSGSARA